MLRQIINKRPYHYNAPYWAANLQNFTHLLKKITSAKSQIKYDKSSTFRFCSKHSRTWSFSAVDSLVAFSLINEAWAMCLVSYAVAKSI